MPGISRPSYYKGKKNEPKEVELHPKSRDIQISEI